MKNLFARFNFGDGLGIESHEALFNGFHELNRGFGPQRLEERERHSSPEFLTSAEQMNRYE
nr:hypothetical protein VITISV_030455 [Ipomoea batatas]GMD86995.1 hypothetical protein VITISV_030455 [Ipomoea batatas]GMD93464.1 hypothetical protein VITISV_030455 [Ipomoea batatas]